MSTLWECVRTCVNLIQITTIILMILFVFSNLIKSKVSQVIPLTLLMRVIFCFILFKIWYRFDKLIKKLGKFFCFLYNCIWIGRRKFALLQREYMSSAVSVLRKSPKVWDITKTDPFELHLFQSDKKNMTKVRSCRFLHCLGPFSMLTAKGSSLKACL